MTKIKRRTAAQKMREAMRKPPLPRLSDEPASEDLAAALHNAGYPVFWTDQKDMRFDSLLVLGWRARADEEFVRQRWRRDPNGDVGISFSTSASPPISLNRLTVYPDDSKHVFMIVVSLKRPFTYALYRPFHSREDERLKNFIETDGERILSACEPVWDEWLRREDAEGDEGAKCE